MLIDTNSGIKKVDYDLPNFEAVCEHNVRVLQDGLNKLLVSAWKDLGIEFTTGVALTAPWSPLVAVLSSKPCNIFRRF